MSYSTSVHQVQMCLLTGTGCYCRAGPQRDPEVISKVGNMWFNPKLPDAKPRRAKPGPAPTSRPPSQGAAGVPISSQTPACMEHAGLPVHKAYGDPCILSWVCLLDCDLAKLCFLAAQRCTLCVQTLAMARLRDSAWHSSRAAGRPW